jgi:hypothetical protein
MRQGVRYPAAHWRRKTMNENEHGPVNVYYGEKVFVPDGLGLDEVLEALREPGIFTFHTGGGHRTVALVVGPGIPVWVERFDQKQG